MKKTKTIVCVCLAVVVLLSVTGVYFHQRTDNVFDCLEKEVRAVRKGGESVLLSGTESAYADYDLGVFQNIQIPELDMCLSVGEQSLYLLFFNGGGSTGDDTLYRYDRRDNVLYGENSLEYLEEHFLTDYFEWCADADKKSKYSLGDLGKYRFVYQENVYYS